MYKEAVELVKPVIKASINVILMHSKHGQRSQVSVLGLFAYTTILQQEPCTYEILCNKILYNEHYSYTLFCSTRHKLAYSAVGT